MISNAAREALPPSCSNNGNHGAAGQEPGAGDGFGCRMAVCPEDAVLLRSNRFLKMCLAPFNWGGRIQMAETGNVGEGEEKPEMVQ